jgi:GT2 family glycosyltransferase
MSNVELSIIIPSFNTKDILKSCLDSIIQNTAGLNYEIILVENGSKDGSLQMIQRYKKKSKRVRLVNARKNLGFGRANNIGAIKSKGEYLLFLNSDTIITDNALRESVDIIKSRKDVGVFSCRLLNSDLSVQESGGHFPNLFNLFAWQLGIDDLPLIGNLVPSFHPHRSQYDKNKSFDWVTGAFMIVPRNVFMLAGMYDKNIFMYTEEMELSFRIAKLGYKTLSVKKPSIIHLGKASGGSELAITSEVQNMIYFWHKHKPSWQLPFAKFAFFFGSLLRLILFGIIKIDEKSRNTYLKALKLSI